MDRLGVLLLIADDQQDVHLVQSLLAGLEDGSFLLEHADRLTGGLERLARGGVEVVLLDLALLELPPGNALLRFQKLAPEVPLVLLADTEDEPLAARIVQHGAAGSLVKNGLDGQALRQSLRCAIAWQRQHAIRNSPLSRSPAVDRLKGEFLAHISHQLRSPLNGIIGFAQLMHDGLAGPLTPAHKEYLGDVLTSARDLLQLVNDITDLSRIDLDALTFQPELLDVEKSIAEVRQLLLPMAARKQIVIDVCVDPGLGCVVTDRVKFEQVLSCYLSNALTATPTEGRVTLRLGPEGEGAFRLEVADSGRTIRSDDLDQVFSEFGPRETDHKGVGPGLGLIKRLVGFQGGRVGVRSTPGQGNVFFAVLSRVALTPDTKE